jgi:DNA helicase-2/ATP-dependent DNA helicase PcrA
MNLNQTIIFGPPGTGKTTQLLHIVNEYLSKGYQPEDICFLAFTRKAANEAKSRAVEKFGLDKTRFPLFRTLHSLAFHRLGVTRQEVMGTSDYISIAQALGIYITCKGINEDGTVSGLSKGDRLLFMDVMARSRMMPLKEYWEKFPNEDIHFYELDRLSRTVRQYKETHQKIDFIDMLSRFIDHGAAPSMKILIVDEAQDLSPIQWSMIESIIQLSTPEHVFVAGDDDQAIFTWAGADVDYFMDLKGNRIILDQSYRVPQKIQEVAFNIISKVEKRVEKPWNPRAEEGEVIHCNDLREIDMSQGTWLLLARNVFLLERYTDFCITSAYVFDSVTGSPVKGASLQAIISWENLRKGESITVQAAIKVYEMFSTRVGVQHGKKKVLESADEKEQVTLKILREKYGLLTDKIWHEAFDRLSDFERTYFLAALRRGEKLLKEPRIKVNTIHGVKGGEADNVVIQTDIAPRTFDEMHAYPDAEHRVWYVAVTRARKRLFILQPTTPLSYEF